MPHFQLSQAATDDVLDFVKSSGEQNPQEFFEQVCDSALCFVEGFFDYRWFLFKEPIHEFVAVTVRDPENMQNKRSLHLRMTLTVPADEAVLTPSVFVFNIFSVRELPIDEMYEIRKCIAESQFPAYQSDKFHGTKNPT